MKYNHEKAKKILQENVSKDIIDQLKQKTSFGIKKSDLPYNFGFTVGKKLSEKNLDGPNLKDEIIIISEILYEALDDSSTLDMHNRYTKDDLFEVALRGIFHGLSEDQLAIVGEIEEEMYE